MGRFIQRNGERIEGIFKRCVQMAYEAGLVGMVVHAVDGTKVAAEVSKGKSIHRGDLEAILRHLEEVVEGIWRRRCRIVCRRSCGLQGRWRSLLGRR